MNVEEKHLEILLILSMMLSGYLNKLSKAWGIITLHKHFNFECSNKRIIDWIYLKRGFWVYKVTLTLMRAIIRYQATNPVTRFPLFSHRLNYLLHDKM